MNENSYSEYAVVCPSDKRDEGEADRGDRRDGGVSGDGPDGILGISGGDAGGAVGCYFAWLCSDMEYETIFLDGTLEIAAVYQKSRRKKKFQCDMKMWPDTMWERRRMPCVSAGSPGIIPLMWRGASVV